MFFIYDMIYVQPKRNCQLWSCGTSMSAWIMSGVLRNQILCVGSFQMPYFRSLRNQSLSTDCFKSSFQILDLRRPLFLSSFSVFQPPFHKSSFFEIQTARQSINSLLSSTCWWLSTPWWDFGETGFLLHFSMQKYLFRLWAHPESKMSF